MEVAVQLVQRWVLARLRNRVFHTLSALNEAIHACLEDLNTLVITFGAPERGC